MNMDSTNIKRQQKDYWTLDKQHVIHPYTNFEKFSDEGSVIYAKGKGHHIYDEQGRAYLDGIAGLWCVNIGHGNEEIAETMAEQSQKLAYYNTFEDASSRPMAELGEKLAEISPGALNHVFYGTGGSMGNDTAVKIAHYYFNLLGKPNKKKILSRDLAYHGSTYLAHAITGISSTHMSFDLPHQLVHYLTAPYTYRNQGDRTLEEFIDFLVDEMEEAIIKIGPDNIAMFFAEPIMGAGGVIVPPGDYHKRTHALCKKYDILYVSDEVVTAFGRLGKMVSSKDLFDVEPDMCVYAKGISSGYIPLGATMISDQIHQVISKPKKDNPYFSHGFTYSGHALSCQVGLKNIEILERDNFCGHVSKWGPYFEEELGKLSEYGIVGEVRGSHYMLALEYVQKKETKESFAPEVNIGKRVYHHAKQLGLIIRPIGNLNVLSPPLTYDQKAIDNTINILRESIERTIKDLIEEGLWQQ
ncbi:aminotransferase [Flammeovirga sp. MY04]|uniref:aminotransferase n=1 Tax=Flammeovirga sp. MY04 TaxID=1191459 RepID=UPI000806116A|nr:aminotransferase [Flammeovirga sp. MY04]